MRPPHEISLWSTPLKESERERIVDRLKQGPGQVLANLAIELRTLLYILDTNVENIRPVLESMLSELEVGLAELQEIVEELYPSMTFRELGLIPWLREIAQRYEQQYHLDVQVEVAPSVERSLPPRLANVFYRVTQEALRNVAQHANAQHVVIRVSEDPHEWRLEVEDDGEGVSEEQLVKIYSSLQAKQTFGLPIMHDLARSVGGELVVLTRSPRGTLVRLRVPHREEAPTSEV